MLLILDFAVLPINIPGPSQNLTSSSVTYALANIISWRQHDVIICPGSGVFKTFTGNMLFHAVRRIFLSMQVLLYHRMILCRLMIKTNNVVVHPAKTQISLGIHPVWSESSLCTQWVAKDPRFLHADSMKLGAHSFSSLGTHSFCWFCHVASQL